MSWRYLPSLHSLDKPAVWPSAALVAPSGGCAQSPELSTQYRSLLACWKGKDIGRTYCANDVFHVPSCHHNNGVYSQRGGPNRSTSNLGSIDKESCGQRVTAWKEVTQIPHTHWRTVWDIDWKVVNSNNHLVQTTSHSTLSVNTFHETIYTYLV